MTGIFYQIISMVAFGTSNALWRKPIDELDAGEAIFYRTIHSFLFFVVLIFVFGRLPEIISGLSDTHYLTIAGLTFIVSGVSFFGLFFYNKALAYSPTGIVATVATVSFLIGQLVAFFILKETFNITFLIPVGFFLITIVLSDFNPEIKFKLSKGTGYGILAAVFWGTTLPLLSIPAKKIGFIETGLILEFTVLILSFSMFYFAPGKRMKAVNFKKLYPWFVLLGFLSGAGILFLNLSYTVIPVHIAGAISSSTHIITIFIAWLLFSEKLNRYQIMAAITAFTGIYLLIGMK